MAAQVVYAGNALADLERAFSYLHTQDPVAAVDAAAAIGQAIEMLSDHPLIGRRIRGTIGGDIGHEIRELVISYGKTGYIALYRFLPEQNSIRVLAIRHQRELDYSN